MYYNANDLLKNNISHSKNNQKNKNVYQQNIKIFHEK